MHTTISTHTRDRARSACGGPPPCFFRLATPFPAPPPSPPWWGLTGARMTNEETPTPFAWLAYTERATNCYFVLLYCTAFLCCVWCIRMIIPFFFTSQLYFLIMHHTVLLENDLLSATMDLSMRTTCSTFHRSCTTFTVQQLMLLQEFHVLTLRSSYFFTYDVH